MTVRQIVVDHIDLRVKDLAASRALYEAALAPLGFTLLHERHGRIAFGVPGIDDFGLSQSDQPTTGMHLAFAAPSREAVDRFHAIALAHGARDNGAPGIRAEYSAGYYGAFVLDLEGNNLEAVFHGPSASRERIIGVEEHGLTRAIRDAVAAERQAVVMKMPPDIDRRLLDFDAERLRDMDAIGMDIAVLSISAPATQILDAPLAVTLAREANDLMARAVASHPDRFRAFATLPTPDPVAAEAELRRCVRDLGFVGTMIHGRTGDRLLDHADFAPLLDTAAELGVPVFIHPQVPPQAVVDAYYAGFSTEVTRSLATAGWGWHVETGINAIRLILAGTFDRAPGLQIVLGHWGELVPFYLERIDAQMPPSVTGLAKPVSQYFKEHFHVAPSGLWSYPMLAHAIATLGVERLVFAIDYPFIAPLEGEARTWLENAPITAEQRAAIAHGNIERLLKLSPGVPPRP